MYVEVDDRDASDAVVAAWLKALEEEG